MMALPSGLTRLDFGFSFTLDTDDLFFFFWSSRPILSAVLEGECLSVVLTGSLNACDRNL